MKENNNRRYPDANHQPKHKAKLRKEESLERQVAYDKLTVEQKIKRLDDTLGVGLGATKQRARLASLFNKHSSKEEVTTKVVESEQVSKPNKKKGSK